MRRTTYILWSAIAAAFITPAASLAQVDTSDWKCEYCPFDKGYRAEYDVGASNVSGEDGYRYGNGTGYDEETSYAELGGEGRYVGDRVTYDWYAEDLGLDSRVVALSFGKPGSFDVSLGYRELPYRQFGSTSTVFSADGGVLSLPSTWTTAGSTDGLTDLDESLRIQTIGSDRQIFDLGIGWEPTRNVDLFVDYRMQQRDGIDIATGSTFTNAAYLPRYIDDETDAIDAGVRFDLGNFGMQLAWYGSFYRNNVVALRWDNPFTAIPGAETMQMALEPDNDFQQFSLSGAYRADIFDTVVAFSVANGRGEQRNELLPATINPNFAFIALVPQQFDGKVDTTNYALTVTAKPVARGRIRFSYRFDERDNRTPVASWSRIIADSFDSGELDQNVPWSYEKTKLGLSGSYRLLDTLTLSAGYDQTDLEREFQEVADQTEYSGWGKVRWRLNGNLEAVFKGGSARRDIDEYDTDIGLSFGQNPLMRKYNLAHRYREFADVTLSATLPEPGLSVGLNWLYANDDYSKSELGMLESEENRFTFDVSWSMGERSSLYLNAGNQSIDASQAGSETFDGPIWQATHDDDFNYFGGGFSIKGVGEKVDLEFDYSRSDGETEILYSGAGVSGSSLPELETTMDSLRLTLSYAWSERMSTDLVVRYEAFETDDWALDGVLPATIPAVLTMGAEAYDYDIWAIGVGFRYRVGLKDD